MTDSISLGSGAEFDAIRALLARWGDRAVGIGDDGAVLIPPRGDQLVASVDTSVEYRHFRREWLAPRDIGYRAVTAALSDLAAMAARPAGVLVAITLADSWRDHLLDIADGIGDAVDAVGTKIRGGNLSGGSELSISTTVLGWAHLPLSRAGARVGDGVYVTGELGGSADALARLRAGQSPSQHHARFLRPAARILPARWLADRGATAAIDISDGLAADLGQLAAASAVSIAVDSTHIPCVALADAQTALGSGEEYELIVTMPNADVGAFRERFDLRLTCIGRVVDGPAGVISIDGAPIVRPVGFDHFSRR